MKTVSQKMGIKGNSRAIFMSAPTDAIYAMQHPAIDVAKKLTGGQLDTDLVSTKVYTP